MPNSFKLVAVALLALLMFEPRGYAQAPATGTSAAPLPEPMAGLGPRRDLISQIKSWGYQLQNAEPDEIARSPYDLVVIDYSRSGDDENLFQPEDLRRMQAKADGSRRFVLAYLSIGEAETYRFYWHADWVEPLQVVSAEPGQAPLQGAGAKGPVKGGTKAGAVKAKTLNFPRLSAPVWLGRENESWAGNFFVRYWEKSWQDIIFGSRGAYLEQIIEAGFDGVYLDRVDAFYSVTDERAEGKADMVRFVSALAKHARALKPGFIVVPQNGEELLLEPPYIATIDAIAKEDLLYGNPTEGQPSAAGLIRSSLNWLMPARKLGLPVLVVEYTLDKDLVDRLRTEHDTHGHISYFGLKSLDRLMLPDDLKSAAALAKTAQGAKSAATQKSKSDVSGRRGGRR